MAYVAREFFPRLVPERSIVLNQDYLFPFQPWVIMAMELLSDCFTLEYAAPTECTTVHRCIKPMSAEMVSLRLQDYWARKNIWLIERAAERLSTPANKATLRGAQINAMWQFGMRRAAIGAAWQMRAEYFLDLETPKFKRLFGEIGLPTEAT